MMAGHQLPLVGLEHHPHHQHHNDVEARLAASRISISAFSKVGGEIPHGMELSQMLSIGAMGRMPRPWDKEKAQSGLKRKKTKRKKTTDEGWNNLIS